VLHTLLIAWALVAALQLLLWLIAQRTRNAGIVDVGWAASFTLAIAWFVHAAATGPAAYAPLAITVAAWSLRLTAHLVARGAATGPEEGRYEELRRRWSPHASRAFFIFFQAQAALTAFLCLSLIAPFLHAPHAHLTWLRWLGTAVSAVGILGESLADWQLSRFRRAHAGQKLVCDVGLWRYSRHPNYFFEWLVWVGYALHGLAYPTGWLALSGQALILTSIWKVTGIPATEEQALRSRGDAYRRYQATTSAFVPWPRRPAPDAPNAAPPPGATPPSGPPPTVVH
jgi:steroid 5-alpha reductase family enzyme